MEGHYLQTDRGNIFYRIGGKEEPLLFLHGNGEDSSIFEKQYPFFQDKFEVFSMDTRGHGKSDLAVENLTFQRISEDILLLLEKHRLSYLHIIGYSDGGNIGLYFASHYPEKVHSLITLGANFEVDGLIHSAFQEILSEKERILQIQNQKEKKKRFCIHQLMADELKLTSEDLRKISIPVLVMAGENDVIKRSQTEKITTLISGAVCKIVPDGGHDFFITQPMSLEVAANEFYNAIKQEE